MESSAAGSHRLRADHSPKDYSLIDATVGTGSEFVPLLDLQSSAMQEAAREFREIKEDQVIVAFNTNLPAIKQRLQADGRL